MPGEQLRGSENLSGQASYPSSANNGKLMARQRDRQMDGQVEDRGKGRRTEEWTKDRQLEG